MNENEPGGDCICGLSSPEKARPEWHRESCPSYAPPSVRVPKGLGELELAAFRFYDPDPNWRSERHAEDFARKAAAFAAAENAAQWTAVNGPDSGCPKCKLHRVCEHCGHFEGPPKPQNDTNPRIHIDTWGGKFDGSAPANPMYAHELIQLAIDQKLRIPQMPILIEDLPNGTSRMIPRNTQITLRDHMRFVITEGNDNA